MPRQPRIEYEGAIYHVMNRGYRREDIVRGRADRLLFLTTLAETCVKCSWEVHAFCLMRNHFHLAVETPLGNLVAGMKWFLGAYTIRFNTRHQQQGHLFAGRYKSLLVDDRDPRYLGVVCDYIHLNPSRAGLLKAGKTLDSYPWSSFPAYLQPPTKRPPWLRVDRVLGEHGIAEDNRQGRLRFGRQMEEMRTAESETGEYREIRRGWRFGAEEFVARTLDRLEGGSARNRTQREVAESMEQRARRLISGELRLAGWRAGRLPKEPKGHPVKVRAAQRLRAETTMSLRWIAAALSMGSWTYVSNLLRQSRSKPKIGHRV